MRETRGGDGRERGGVGEFLPFAGARLVVNSLIEGCFLAAAGVLLELDALTSVAAGLVFAVARVVQRVARERGCSVTTLLATWPSHGNFDGVYFGGADGELLEVFDPPWWRVDRWRAWFFASGRRRAVVTIPWRAALIVLRAMSVRYEPPSVRRKYVQA